MSEPLKCIECGVEVRVVGDDSNAYYEPTEELLDSNKKKHPVPFFCQFCGAIKFPYRPLGDKVFVLSDPIETHIGILEIPEEYRKEKRRSGTIVAIGKGYYDDKGKFHATELKVGERVSYNPKVPWKMSVLDAKGTPHRVEFMGERDIQVSLDGDFDENTIE